MRKNRKDKKNSKDQKNEATPVHKAQNRLLSRPTPTPQATMAEKKERLRKGFNQAQNNSPKAQQKNIQALQKHLQNKPSQENRVAHLVHQLHHHSQKFTLTDLGNLVSLSLTHRPTPQHSPGNTKHTNEQKLENSAHTLELALTAMWEEEDLLQKDDKNLSDYDNELDVKPTPTPEQGDKPEAEQAANLTQTPTPRPQQQPENDNQDAQKWIEKGIEAAARAQSQEQTPQMAPEPEPEQQQQKSSLPDPTRIEPGQGY